MRVRPGLRALRRGADEVQVGTDPRWAVRLTDLSPDEVAGLLADPPHASAAVEALLAEAGLLADDEGLARRAACRAEACAGVIGLGPAGLGVALGLAAAGVGTVLVDDERTVGPQDVGPTGFRWAQVGADREVVAAQLLRDVAPRIRLVGRPPDVLVVVEEGAADPERAQLLVGLGVTHVPVVVREGDVVVGPVVVPGQGPCLRCLDLHRTDLDPAWPVVLGGLVTGAGSGAAGTSTASSNGDGDGAGHVAAVAAGLATAMALAVLDGERPAPGRCYEVGLPDAVPRVRDWPVHPSCGCTGLPS